MVPSPEPLEVVEQGVIESLLRDGYHVVAVGGGGIPVIRTGRGLEGVDAVIDKDLASSLLANLLESTCSSSPRRSRKSRYTSEHPLKANRPDDRAGGWAIHDGRSFRARKHAAQDSGRPALLKGGGKKVIITAPEFIKDAVVNGRGTHIVP